MQAFSHPIPRPLPRLAGVALACIALLSGCSGSKELDAPNTGLLALTQPGARGASILKSPAGSQPDPGDITALADQAALDLQQVIDSGALDRAHKHLDASPKPASAGTSAAASDAGFVGPPAPAELSNAAPEGPTAPSQDALLDLARQMAVLLQSGSQRIPDAVALAPIEAMQPGVLADLESPKSALGVKLSVEDRRALTDARDRVLAEPGAASEALTRTLARLAPPAALKIGRAVLCTKVQGFGRYEPLNTDRFVFGQTIRAIVYIELEGFMTRPARSTDPVDPSLSVSDQVSVELSQSMTLFHDPSGLQAKYIPWQTIVDTGRNKRRDFYVIQQIELPSLSIGRYNLKIAIKDATSGGEAEAVLPINIVADASALTTMR